MGRCCRFILVVVDAVWMRPASNHCDFVSVELKLEG